MGTAVIGYARATAPTEDCPMDERKLV